MDIDDLYPQERRGLKLGDRVTFPGTGFNNEYIVARIHDRIGLVNLHTGTHKGDGISTTGVDFSRLTREQATRILGMYASSARIHPRKIGEL